LSVNRLVEAQNPEPEMGSGMSWSTRFELLIFHYMDCNCEVSCSVSDKPGTNG
jgi:hypothetical protein